jgi:hypothetical protein
MECEIAQFYDYSEPVARKMHHCCECSAPIVKGEEHFAWRGKWAGEMMTGRQHFLCMEACMMLRDVFNDFECIPFGGLFDFYHEYRRDLADHPRFKELVRLIVKIRRRERGTNNRL